MLPYYASHPLLVQNLGESVKVPLSGFIVHRKPHLPPPIALKLSLIQYLTPATCYILEQILKDAVACQNEGGFWPPARTPAFQRWI